MRMAHTRQIYYAEGRAARADKNPSKSKTGGFLSARGFGFLPLPKYELIPGEGASLSLLRY